MSETNHTGCNTTRSLAIAESLCAPCLTTALPKKTKTQSGRIHRGWLLTEIALATSDIGTQKRLLNDAGNCVGQALLGRAGYPTWLKGTALQGVLPAMGDRARGASIAEAHRQTANHAFGDGLVAFRNAHRAKNMGHAAETLAPFLMSRPEAAPQDFLYPTSPREEASTQHKNLNHDGYMLWPAAAGNPSKFPLQIKLKGVGSAQYDVPCINMQETLKPVLEVIGSPDVADVIRFAIDERLGIESDYQSNVLDFAGHCLKTRIEAAAFTVSLKDMQM